MSTIPMLHRLGQVSPKTTVMGVILANMVCRPNITLSNKSLPPETRKYTAMREFCTEFFGVIWTFILGTVAEKALPKVLAGKIFKGDTAAISQAFKNLKDNVPWDKLSNAEKSLRGAMTLSSFIGTALAVAVITPLLNNVVLNKVMGKIQGKDKKPAGDTPQVSGPLLAKSLNSEILEASPAFKNFVSMRSQGKTGTTLNVVK